MKEDLKVTVLMCEYNTRENELKESIESILNQSYRNFEFLIIDDDSNNNLLELIKKYNDSRIKIVKNEKNLGLEKSLNIGINLAKGKYILRMDTDDIAHFTRIEKQLAFIEENSQYAIVASRVNVFDEEGIYKVTEKTGEIEKKEFLFGTPLIHPSMIINKETLLKIGGYPLEKRAEDYAMAMNLYAEGYKAFIMKDILLDYRMNNAGYKKKKYIYRFNEVKVRFKYFKKLNIKWYQKIYIFKPLIVGLIPKKLLKEYHKKVK